MAVYKNSAPFGSIVTDGLVLNLDATNRASYPGSGTTWNDTSFYRNNGTLTNGPTFLQERGRGSIVFDGVDDYVNSNNGIVNNSDFSVSFWIKYQDTLAASRGIISTWDTSWNGFGIASQNSGYIRSWTNNGAGGGVNWDLTSTIKDRWANLVLVYTFSNKTQRCYIDTILKVTEAFGATITHSTLQIGRGGQTGSTQLSLYPYTNCLISAVQIYNRALSAQEVQQNYNALKSRFGL